ncbi:MAG: galactosyltransferase-related protein [Mangrovibacterium sp.]
MKNITDTTFIIPIRVDSHVRLENILLITRFLIEHFDTKIKILECAPYNNGLLSKLLEKTITYCFQEDNDSVFYRTKYINQMVRTVDTPYVSVWDADVITPVDQIVQAIELLRTGEADFIYSYEKQFLDTSFIIRKLFIQERKMEILEQNIKKMKAGYLPDPVGGAFFANLKAYKEVGFENENFYGWGPEDIERFRRWKNLGYRVKRVSGPLFHLSHERGVNSRYRNSNQYYHNFKEIGKTCRYKTATTY